MSSTFECSRNDVASNVGVLAAAGLVGLTGSAWTDIIVGGLIAVIFLRSAWRVLGETWPAWRAAKAPHRESLQCHETPPVVRAGLVGPYYVGRSWGRGRWCYSVKNSVRAYI